MTPLLRNVCIFILYMLFVKPFQLLFSALRQTHKRERIVQEDQLGEEECLYDNQDCPEFIQILNISENTVLGINRVEWIPDETAIVYILTDTNVSKPFKKKVYEWRGEKYIKLGAQKIFLKT